MVLIINYQVFWGELWTFFCWMIRFRDLFQIVFEKPHKLLTTKNVHFIGFCFLFGFKFLISFLWTSSISETTLSLTEGFSLFLYFNFTFADHWSLPLHCISALFNSIKNTIAGVSALGFSIQVFVYRKNRFKHYFTVGTVLV